MKRILLLAAALLTIASTDPVKDTRQIMAGTVTTKTTKNAYLSGARDGTAAFQGALAAYKAVRAAEAPPAPVPTPQWVSAPLKDGGYARCKAVGGCHGFASPYPPIIAQQGQVLMYAWNGCDAAVPCRAIGAFWPIGQYKTATPYVGFEGFVDEWEGVAP